MNSQTVDLAKLREQVRRYAQRRMRDQHAAEDIAQDVMLRLHEHRHTVSADPRRLAAWAIRAARNAIVDRHRASRHRLRVQDLADVAARAAEPSARQTTRRLAGCLLQMVQRLPQGYRTAVEQADLLGRPQLDVARALGLSLSAVKSRVQRGRQQLRSMLAECCRIDLGRDGNVRECEPTRPATNCSEPGRCEKSCVL
jgi:RNA polymerase sigma-70 factor (ECF subfamily)